MARIDGLYGVASGVSGLPDDEQAMLCDLVGLWSDKLSRNETRYRYYRMKNRLKDLDISIPPALKSVVLSVGWPAKAVDALAARSRFDGFAFSGDVGDDVSRVLSSNVLKMRYRQAVTSELVSSCSFATVTKGHDAAHPVAIRCYSAMSAAARWDWFLDRVKYGMAVMDVREDGHGGPAVPVHIDLFTDDAVWEVKRDAPNARWRAERFPHSVGRPLIEAFRYCPDLDRPFGKSRISRSVMTLTDSMVRSMLRAEVAAEFFTSPQRYLLGADESAFDGDKWDTYVGSIVAFGRDGSTGEKPTYGQFSAQSMQPHVEYMRHLAARFSGETCVPLSELGIVSDNPSSAEAIYAAKEPLIMEAECLNDVNGEALRNIAVMAMCAVRNVAPDGLTDAELSVVPRFKNPAAPSVVSQADAIVKLAGVFEWFKDSDVALEESGFNEDQIARMSAERRRAQARARVDALMPKTAQPEA